MDAQNYKTALAHFNECLRLDPYLWKPITRELKYEKVWGDSKGALTDFSITLSPNHKILTPCFQGQCYGISNKQWAVAREDFLKLLSAPPGENQIHFLRTEQGRRHGNRNYTK